MGLQANYGLIFLAQLRTKIVTLTRDYQGESVIVELHMTNLVTGDKGDDEEEEHEDKPEKPKQSNVPLLVTLSKKTGTSLEFRCTAFPDKIVIKDMVLDEKLRKGFHRYIEIRGITPSMINFLHEYMINKDGKEHLLWLKTLKNFVKS
ncbi:unnamed protein product [Eruca vesicaria subsp. sativa]|uniref:Mitochondrial glycoprotein family protein n=1 Tax=Eruca vesicaria subsp. sativa TaxID=29727 RepID=A0ABC8IQJ9_ERUVS|nr:unnamed protein product [Eruca vesicaria subsp. sativa]